MADGMKEFALYAVLIGAINWGLGIFNVNLVELLGGLVGFDPLVKILYAVIGLSGAYLLYEKLT